MKKFLYLLFFISSVSYSQYTIKGSLEPINKYNWVLLYKVEGAKQTFIKNASLTKKTKTVNGKSVQAGTFEFEIPDGEKKAVYRITYDVKNNGFADVFFNKENINFIIDPSLPQVGLKIISSKENKLFQDYSNAISKQQYKVDSTQIAYLKSPSSIIASNYKKELLKLNTIQKQFEAKSKNTFVLDFIKASKRYNSSKILGSYNDYVKTAISHFFDFINFENPNLLNSSFLVDRIADYVFYMNFAQKKEQRQLFYKRAANQSLEKIKNVSFKADVIEFLVTQFATQQNAELVDFLFDNHFSKLPKDKQRKEFKDKIKSQLVTAIGNTAPDFSWTENGKIVNLSTLSDGKNYLLLFYSTGCSHCLREVPEVYKYLKDKPNTKVIAFAMEEKADVWKNYMKQFKGWHHVLGLEKWENKVARTYQINSTPTYFVLNGNKKIIANPEKLEDLKKILKQLN